MFCISCLKSVTSKLQPDDLVVLEYLKEQQAITPQFALSKKHLMNELNLTIHKITESLHRLDILDMTGFNQKTHKYFITDLGIKAIQIFEDKIIERIG